MTEFREHGDEYSGSQKAGKFFFDCTTYALTRSAVNIYEQIIMSITPLTWYNGRDKSTEMLQIPFRSPTSKSHSFITRRWLRDSPVCHPEYLLLR
jgi:hypothetical protein